MIPLASLHELFEYNYWARDRQFQACATLSEEQFLRPMGNSFSSLRDTLAHLVGAEWIWLERWLGRSPRALLRAEEFRTLASLRQRWQVVERDMREYLAKLNETALAQSLSYVNLKGERWTYPLWKTLYHLVNHQTYHRGQVTTLLRQMGAQAVPIDFMIFQDVGTHR